tara:strand:+ start:1443 stop:1697 length:255 start_codon:yes stop_codon:yes gene_type:complete
VASRKDYLIIADSLRKSLEMVPHREAKVIIKVIRNVSYALGRENRKFDPSKFALACGLTKDFGMIPQVDGSKTRRGPSVRKEAY